jgi:NAD(P)-dependent dehydrogenase (short-subunit alcohol dehydrogenase family)
MQIQNAVAVVTGGASGLGQGTAELLSSLGAHVDVYDLQSGAGVTPVDVTSAEQVQAAIAGTVARHGRLDIVVHCAGIGYAGRMLPKDGPMPLDVFERVIRVNLIGTFNVSRLAAAAMATNTPRETAEAGNADGERGVIINTSSVAAYDGQIGQVPYSAAKAAVAGMTLPMARELAKLGIRVMAIAPGLFHTPLLAALPAEAMQQLAAGIPFPSRLGTPAEFASLARHIIENRYLNGEVIRLDGSLRMPPK